MFKSALNLDVVIMMKNHYQHTRSESRNALFNNDSQPMALSSYTCSIYNLPQPSTPKRSTQDLSPLDLKMQNLSTPPDHAESMSPIDPQMPALELMSPIAPQVAGLLQSQDDDCYAVRATGQFLFTDM